MSWSSHVKRANALDAEVADATKDLIRHAERLRILVAKPTFTIGAGLIMGFACARMPAMRVIALARLGRQSLQALVRPYRKPA